MTKIVKVINYYRILAWKDIFNRCVRETEAESILQSIYKARTEGDFKDVFRVIQQKMELYTAECEGDG